MTTLNRMQSFISLQQKLQESSQGIPSMPEFSTERLTVDDVSKMTGIPTASVRAGIVYGWLPIGTATRNNKVVKSLTGEKTSFFISPRKLYEETGYVWRGKAALAGKESA